MKLHSDACTALVASFEGFRANAYLDQGGVPTIGFGATRIGGGRAVMMGDVTTEDVARIWLSSDLDRVDICINNTCLNEDKINTVTQPQFDAMVSLAFNIGCSAFGHSTVLRLFNAGDIPNAAIHFLDWVKVDGVFNQGLYNRRAAEKQLFLTSDEG